MPYDQGEDKAMMVPKSQFMFDRIKKYNDRQQELLGIMHGKLNALHNKLSENRAKEVDQGRKNTPANDFINAMNTEIDRLANQTETLEDLSKHLSEII